MRETSAEIRVRWDAAACASLLPAAAEAMRAALGEFSGHTSSVHAEGRAARRRCDAAREAIADYWGGPSGALAPESVVLGSGGTEANATALRCGAREPGGIALGADAHPSLRESAAGPVVAIAADRDGSVPVARFVAAAREARLVSLGWVCHESGRVLPAAEIARAIGRDARERDAPPPRLHLDACAEGGRLGPSAARSVAPFFDFVSLAAEKFGGPIGIGALLLPRPDRIGDFAALLPGSAQFGRRGGGVSAVLAAGFAAAVAERAGASGDAAREALAHRTRALVAGLRSALGPESDETWRFAADPAAAAPGILLLSFPGLVGEEIAARCDLEGVSLSSGAACASGAGKGSEVLRARGWTEPFARGAVRISLDPAGDEAEDVRGLEIFARSVAAFRRRPVVDASPYGSRVRALVAVAAAAPTRRVADPFARVECENPACGDRLEFAAGLEAGRLRISYRAAGCPPLLAAAEAAARRLDGAAPEALGGLDRAALLDELADLPASSRHAVDLVAEAIAMLAARRPAGARA